MMTACRVMKLGVSKETASSWSLKRKDFCALLHSYSNKSVLSASLNIVTSQENKDTVIYIHKALNLQMFSNLNLQTAFLCSGTKLLLQGKTLVLFVSLLNSFKYAVIQCCFNLRDGSIMLS